MRVLVTGATGYIGQRLVAHARALGHDVNVLGRSAPDAQIAFFPWMLGDTAPFEALAGVDAVIHLAHSWHTETAEGACVNSAGSESLAREALAAGIPRFLFASTTSARETALNAYGQRKYALERHLATLPGAPGQIVSARIGLVYGGPPSGQYGLMRRIVGLTPVLPMIGLDRQVQPIHLDEVCEALLTLAFRSELNAPYYVIAGERPISFAQWLRILRRAVNNGRLILIPIPIRLMLLACDVTRLIPFVPTVNRERVLGLAGAAPMESSESLEALKLRPGDPATLLARERISVGAREARALLQYLAVEAVTGEMERSLLVGLQRTDLSPLGLPSIMLAHPALIILAEPPASRQSNRLAQALHLASLVIEAHAMPNRRHIRFFRAVPVVILDILLLPVRIFVSRRFQ